MHQGTGSDMPIKQPTEFEPVVDRLSAEFHGMFGRQTVARVVSECANAMGPSRVQLYKAVFVERFARERLRALAARQTEKATRAPSILFLCTHNAGRSQMAAGWTRHVAGDEALVFSGGSEPADEVNPVAIEAMREVGIDISAEFPKPWSDEVLEVVDVVVTMGCGDACPIVPGVRYVDWEIEDPAGLGLGAVRQIRDVIESRVRGLLGELGVTESA